MHLLISMLRLLAIFLVVFFVVRTIYKLLFGRKQRPVHKMRSGQNVTIDADYEVIDKTPEEHSDKQ